MESQLESHGFSDSFRLEYTARPAGFRTPPPPSAAVEPLSPVLLPTKPGNAGAPGRKRRRYEEPDNYNQTRWEGASNVGPRNYEGEASPPSASPRLITSHSHLPTYYRSQLSPTALDVFAAVATSPDLAQGAFSPPANRQSSWSQQQSNRRGSKRSLSEAYNFHSEQHSAFRPSTNYPGRSTLSHEHLASAEKSATTDRTLPRYTDRNLARPQFEGTMAVSRLEEAELLLSFARGGDYRLSQPPHDSTDPQPSTTKYDRGHTNLYLWTHQRIGGPLNDPWSLRGRPTMANGIDSSPSKARDPYHDDLNRALPNALASTGDNISGVRGDNTGKTNSALHSWPFKDAQQEPPKKPRVHKGWPKGKPRGKRTNTANVPPTKKPTTKKATKAEKTQQTQRLQKNQTLTSALSTLEDYSLPKRPKSAAGYQSRSASSPTKTAQPKRACSVPLTISMTEPSQKPPKASSLGETKLGLCSLCQHTNSLNGYHELWITCNGCKEWFHTVCVGFKTEREVRDVDKFYCPNCEPKHGKTTLVRKSSRAHASVDYAGLNEGQVRTSTDTFEHHFIQPIKDGTLQFLPEKFPRMPPELVTAAFFERSGTMSEPILIPASMNPQPGLPGVELETESTLDSAKNPVAESTSNQLAQAFEYDCVPDDGQDKMGMVMPKGLTIRHVANLLGPERPLQVIDVKSQDQGDTTWNLQKWADYYETPGEKPVRNVISLEVSQTKLSRLIRRPQIVRDLDLQDHVWPQDELDKGKYPQVQFYCLMSVADCYTDFHIDFGGSSVYYHILRGKKTFFFIPPKRQHLKKYEEWCVSPNQESIFLGEVTNECYRVDLSEGDTMLIPSGWIHAVWTPENSLVIGGNFLTRMHYGMQIQINEIEKNTGVARMFRYPNFQKVMWYTVIQYLQEDPVPYNVAQILYDGGRFPRESPVYFDFDPPELGDEESINYFNARYYSEGEIEGLGDLLNFVFRTVMISLGLVPLPKSKQDAVVRSLPKGYGDHLDLLRTFAIWITWKRGNEELPIWAHPDAPISELEVALAEKKTPAAMGKKSEREINRKGATPERRSQRQAPKAKGDEKASQVLLSHMDIDQNSAPDQATQGAKRIWCEACRRSRVRCKHREPGDQIDSAERFGIKRVSQVPPELADSVHHDLPNLEESYSGKVPDQLPHQFVSCPSPQLAKEIDLDSGLQTATPTAAINGNPPTSSTQVRIKACEECRKSKRRCIHDADGKVDPVKAMQNPVPRAFSATKRIRHDPSTNGLPTAKRVKVSPADGESKLDENYDDGHMNSEVATPEVLSIDHEAHTTLDLGLSRATFDDNIFSYGSHPDLPQDDSMSTQSSWINNQANFNSQYLGQSEHVSRQQRTETSRDESNGDLHAMLKNTGSELPVFDHTAVVIDIPANQSESENRSRTPSLHIQTNSTESLDRSRSPPTSPITEIDPSSPVQPKQEEQLGDIPQVHLAPGRQHARHRKQVKGLPLENGDMKSPHTPGITKEQEPFKSTAKRSTKSGSRNSNASRGMSMDIGPAGRSGSPARAKSQAMSPTEETVEDESMRLARQLQEQEFGLRRRSK